MVSNLFLTGTCLAISGQDSAENLPGLMSAAPPSELGFNQEELKRAVRQIGLLPGVYSLLVVRNNKLAIERYFREGAPAKAHNIKSASKIILSALTGIAIDQGRLRLDQPISEILPQFKKINDPKKKKITVRHLLTMTSGLLPTSYQAYNVWTSNENWVKAALDRPLVAEPGTNFQYSTGDTHILSAVLTAAIGMSTREYAEQKLFNPMAIKVIAWESDPQGINIGGNNLSLLSRDLARIGQLYLNYGNYGGRQLIPRSWVEESTRADRSGVHEVYGSYAYLWYTATGFADAYTAVGYGGQYLYVLPRYNCVVVVTSTIESKGLSWTKDLFAHLRFGIVGSLETVRHDRDFITAVKDYRARSVAGPTGRTTANIVLRAEPDRSGKKIGLVPKDVKISILESRGQWYRTSYADNEGWLFNEYVNFEPTEPQQGEFNTAEPVVDASGTGNAKSGLTIDLLNLRSGPSRDDTVIVTLNPHTFLEIKEQQGSWLRVQTGKLKGWVDSRFVSLVPSDQAGLLTEKTPVFDNNIILKPMHVQLASSEALRQQPAGADIEELQALTAQINEQKELSERMQRELAEIRSDVKAREKSGNNLEQELEPIRNQLRSEQKTLQDLQLGWQDVSSQLGRLRTELTDREKAASRTISEQENLKNNITSVSAQISELQTALKSYLANRDYLGAELDGLRQEITAMKENAAHAQNTGQSLVSEIVGIREHMASLDKKLTSDQATETAALKKTLAAQHGEIAGSKETGQRLGREMAALREQIETTTAELNNSQKSRSELTARFEKLNQELKTGDGDKTRLAETDRLVQAELNKLRGQLGQISSALDDSQKSRAELTARFEKLNQELKTGNGDKTRLAETDRLVQAELNKLRGQLGQISSALDDSQKNRNELKNELATIKEQLRARQPDNNQTELTAVLRQLESFKEMLRDYEKNNERNQREIAKLNLDLDIQRQATGDLEDSQDKLTYAFNSNNRQATAVLTAPQKPAAKQLTVTKPDRQALAPDKVIKLAGNGKVPSTITETQPQLDLAGVEQFVTSWADAWSRQDVNAYLSHYSDHYQPPDKMTLSQWQQQRRSRISKPALIEIKTEDLQKKTAGEQVQVNFKQHYRSDTYQDKVQKTLFLARENGDWKIIRESSR